MYLKNILNFLNKQYKNIFLNIDKKYDVIIYDDSITHPIIECIDSCKKIYVLKIRELELVINFKIFFNTVRFFFRREIFLNVKKNNFRNGFLRYGKDAYHWAIINEKSPKTVITFVDNNPRFGRLSSYFKDIRFIAIQNGMRYSWQEKFPCAHDIYLTFTTTEFKLLSKLGWKIRENYSIGSVNAARVFKSLGKSIIKRDLLIISGWWTLDLDKDIDCINHYKAMKKMNIYLRNLIINNKYNAAIILRTNRDYDGFYSKEVKLNEKEFYQDIYGDGCSIIENKTIRKGVYEEINRSNLSVSLLTAAILEGHIYGHNCLYLNFFENNYYHEDCPQDIVVSSKNILLMDNKIKEKIEDSRLRSEEIFNISKEKANLTIKNFKKIIN